MDNVFLDIVNFLMSKNAPVSSAEIASEVGISTKTVFNKLKLFNDDLKKEGGRIVKKPGKGIWLEVFNEESWSEQSFLKKKSIFDQPKQRMDFIILSLLTTDNPISQEDFAEKLFVSFSTVGNDLTHVRKELLENELRLVNIRSKGYVIDGEESNLRKYFSKKINTTDWLEMLNDESGNISFSQIKKVTKNILLEHRFSLSENSFENLCIHIFIITRRIEHASYEETNYDLEKIPGFSKAVKDVSKSLVNCIEEVTNFKVPKIEAYLLMTQLSAKQVIADKDRALITFEILSLVENMINLVKKSFHIDLTEDSDLKMALALHLVPLEKRLQFNIDVSNPLVNEIKQNCPLGFIIANEAVKVIERKTEKTISEDEVSLLALHFNLAIQKHKDSQPIFKKKNIIIVCGTGVGSAKMLEHQILDKFEKYLGQVHITDFINLESIDLSNFDFILTTIPIKKKFKIPLIDINYFLTKDDVRKLEILFSFADVERQVLRFFSEDLFLTNIQSKTKSGVIKQLLHVAKRKIHLPDGMFSSIMKRERLFSTEIGNMAAIPHPFELFETQTCAIIGILEEPIIWDTKSVQIVMLLIVGKNDRDNLQLFYQLISKYLVDETKIQALIKERDFNFFLGQIREIIKEDGGLIE